MTGFGDVAGFVLVGGRSSRMGRDKALMDYHGLPLAGHIANELATVIQPVSLVGDPERYADIGHPVIPDDYPGAGPLGGLITALRTSRSRWNLVVACDLPGVSSEIFRRLLDQIQFLDVQCVIPVTPDEREQVLCALYRRDACGALLSALESGEPRLQSAVRRLQAHYWRVDSGEWSVNLNTPEDWNVYMGQEA
jgi:molybdenum cofactor guanylyltransferase